MRASQFNVSRVSCGACFYVPSRVKGLLCGGLDERDINIKTLICLECDVARIAGTIRHSLYLSRVFHQNGITFQCDIAAVSNNGFPNVGLNCRKNEIPSVKVRYTTNFYMIALDMDTAILNARSCVSYHRGVDERSVLNQDILTYLNVDTSSDRFSAIYDRTRTSNVGGDGGVIQ